MKPPASCLKCGCLPPASIFLEYATHVRRSCEAIGARHHKASSDFESKSSLASPVTGLRPTCLLTPTPIVPCMCCRKARHIFNRVHSPTRFPSDNRDAISMRSSVIAVACLVAACASTQAFVLPSTFSSSTTTTSARQQPRALSSSTSLAASSSPSMHDRRGLLFKTTGSLLGLAGLALVRPANAYDEVPLVRDKLGGLLEPYTDIAKVREGGVERKWRGCGAVDDEERRGAWQNE